MHWKARGRIAAALLLATGLVAGNAGEEAGRTKAGDRTIDVAETDRAMNAARSAARTHLETFLDHTVRPDGASAPGAAIKVAMPRIGGSHEIIWVSPFRAEDGALSGRLANAPNDLPGLVLGDEVRFTRDDVRDWSFWGEDGTLYGSFTTRVLLPRMRPGNAARVAEVLSAAPLPSGW